MVSELKIGLLHSHLRTEAKIWSLQELSTPEASLKSVQGCVLVLQREPRS